MPALLAKCGGLIIQLVFQYKHAKKIAKWLVQSAGKIMDAKQQPSAGQDATLQTMFAKEDAKQDKKQMLIGGT